VKGSQGKQRKQEHNGVFANTERNEGRSERCGRGKTERGRTGEGRREREPEEKESEIKELGKREVAKLADHIRENAKRKA